MTERTHPETEFVQRLRMEALQTDKDDLLAILSLRFGIVPIETKAQIEAVTDGAQLERLVLVAANVPTFESFVEELNESKESFRIVGEGYNPLSATK